jgi:basic membrane protein A and related proteins
VSVRFGPVQSCLALLGAAMLLTFLPARHTRPAVAPDRAGATKPGTRIGLVFDVGGRGDKSFNDAAYRGLERAEEELGVIPSFLEPVGTEDREAALRLFAARGLDLVIAVGFIFTSDVDAVGSAYPNVHFACVDYAPHGVEILPNVLGLAFREEEGSFLVGAVAGLMSKTHTVGFVGGMTIPLIRKFEAGYVAGVAATCPDCVVRSTYAGSTPDAFKDPAKGKALAISEISQGADILFHASGATGHGVFEAAKDAHVLAIGVDSDQYDEMPGTVLTSMVKRVDVAVFETIRAAALGHFAGGIRVFGLRENGVDYVHDGLHGALVASGVQAKVTTLRDDVVSGRIEVPSK